MTHEKIQFNVGTISGGIATGNGAQAMGAGSVYINNASGDVGALIAAIRQHVDALPRERRIAVEGLLGQVQTESAIPTPDKGKIASLLQSIRSIGEGVIGGLITAYLS